MQLEDRHPRKGYKQTCHVKAAKWKEGIWLFTSPSWWAGKMSEGRVVPFGAKLAIAPNVHFAAEEDTGDCHFRWSSRRGEDETTLAASAVATAFHFPFPLSIHCGEVDVSMPHANAMHSPPSNGILLIIIYG